MSDNGREKVRALIAKADEALLWLHRGAAVVAGLIIALATAIVLYQIYVRYFGRNPSVWTLDIATMLMVPVTYLAAGYISRLDGHVSVAFVVDALPLRLRAAAEVLRLLVQLAFVCLLAWYGYRGAMSLFERGYVSGSAAIPLWPTAIAIPLGGALFGLETLSQLAKTLVGPPSAVTRELTDGEDPLASAGPR